MLLLVGVLLFTGCAGQARTVTDPALTRLDGAVSAVSTSRSALLAAVDAIQQAATQLDRTDELCVAGKGQAARASFRTSQPMTRAARQALTGLGPLVTTYSTTLDGLAEASRTDLVRASERAALQAVVRDGRAEAAAVERFRGSLSVSWPAYDRLNADEDLWTTRAVAGWYRTSQEGAAAYAVLGEPRRTALHAARSRLASAAQALEAPNRAAAATLRSADKALERLRSGT